MTIRLYLTITPSWMILYALAFLLIPATASLFFSDLAEPRDRCSLHRHRPRGFLGELLDWDD